MPGYVWDFYKTSLTMSSYLVAMMVSDFISVPSDPSIGHVQFNIWSRAAAKNQTEYTILDSPTLTMKGSLIILFADII